MFKRHQLIFALLLVALLAALWFRRKQRLEIDEGWSGGVTTKEASDFFDDVPQPLFRSPNLTRN
jgi:hypothetical protein